VAITGSQRELVMAKEKKKVDPFKMRKTKTEVTKETDTVTPPPEIAQAIDSYRECQDQAKHFEGEATIHKDTIMGFAQDEYAKRSMKGMSKSFKIMGDETMVTYVIQDSSAGLTEEDVEEFSNRWGEDAAQDLITRDLRSIRFDPNVLAANYEAIVEALQVLPEEILDNLFKPMLMMASTGVIDKAKKYAKTPEELLEIISALKVKNYVR